MTDVELQTRLAAVRAASRKLRSLPDATRNRVLAAAASALESRKTEVLSANARDLAALPAGTDAAFRDRLLLDASRIGQMVEGLQQIQRLADPVGEVVEHRRLDNGLDVRRMRAPLGVIFMIFESRPNVAVEAFSLGFKAGNAMILRGGKESHATVAVLGDILRAALAGAGVSVDSLWVIGDPDRKLVEALLQQSQWIDVVVPRGGDGLIEFVTRTSRIPVIKNDRGLCHVYVHEDADLQMAERIIVNAKCQRPGVCNAMETLLVHSAVAGGLLPQLKAAMPSVHWFGCARTLSLLRDMKDVEAVNASSYDTEYLSLKMSCRIVDSLDEAIAHIERHGSRHSEAIVTGSHEAARRFQDEVDAAAVYWNASTRFTDGFALGLGGELGISTQKLHVRGPVGLRELTSVRWVFDGTGQVRGS